jgi:hypothetical protein
MNNLLILNKENYEIILDKTLQKHSMYNDKEFNQNLYTNIIELVKDMDQINSNYSDYFFFKIEGGKNVIYKKSRETKLAVLIICDKKAIKKGNLIELSKVYLSGIEKLFLNNLNENSLAKKTNMNLFHTKAFTLQVIEQLTIKHIEDLRNNKLYAKFIYYNYNPSVTSSITYKKTKMESTSVILYNSNKDYEKMYFNFNK